MLILKKVAVTGGLSCGKSTVCRIFKDLGASVVSADEIVHQLMNPESHPGQESIYQKIIKLIGSDIVVNQSIDRAAVAKKVFEKPTLLHALEKLLHPAVYDAIESQYQRLKKEGTKGLFVAEIPLLFESNNVKNFDATIAVIAPESLCIQRFKESTGSGEKEFHQRSSRQLDLEEKKRRADYVITNDGSLEDLRRSVKELYNQLTI